VLTRVARGRVYWEGESRVSGGANRQRFGIVEARVWSAAAVEGIEWETFDRMGVGRDGSLLVFCLDEARVG
jgi:hypothetical protein